jgi:flagellin-like hook-associated protein FlgL
VAIKVGSNIASIQAQRRLAEVSTSQSGIYERLSSGQRINRASDDAASLSIASSLDAQGKIFTQGIKNINDGISALSIAESALESLQSISIRQKELAEQAASTVYSTKQRTALQAEADALSAEYNRIVEVTSFNGRRLFQAGGQEIRLQAGVSLQDSFSINMGAALSGSQTITSTGTSTNFTLTAGGFGEQTNISAQAVPATGYYSGRERSAIDLNTIQNNFTFTIYDSSGSSYNFEFVDQYGTNMSGYTTIVYNANWVPANDYGALGSAITNTINSVLAPFTTYHYENSFTNVYSSTLNITANTPGETNNISAVGVAASLVVSGGSVVNPNAGTLQFQAEDGTNYYLWTRTAAPDESTANLAGQWFGTDPGLAGTGIRVDLWAGMDQNSVAHAIANAVNAATSGKVSAAINGAVFVRLTNTTTGNVINSVGTGALSSFTVSDGTLSGRAEVSQFTYPAGSSFSYPATAQETTTISLDNSVYNQGTGYNYNSEITRFQISNAGLIATGDSFTIYNNNTAYNFDFEVNGGTSGNSGYNHIQITGSESESDVALIVANYISTSFSSQFSSYASAGTAIITSLASGLDETNSSCTVTSALNIWTSQDGSTTPYAIYPNLGAFLVANQNSNGQTYSFWYNFSGSGQSNPYSSATYSYQINVYENDTDSNIMSATALALTEAINNNNANFSYSNNGNNITITQNTQGQVPDISVSNSEINATVTQQGEYNSPYTGLYNLFYSPTTSYYTWYQVDGAGSNPNAGGTGIQVNISSAWSANQVASAAASAINSATGGAVTAVAGGGRSYYN